MKSPVRPKESCVASIEASKRKDGQQTARKGQQREIHNAMRRKHKA
jgi:hypothetical protein